MGRPKGSLNVKSDHDRDEKEEKVGSFENELESVDVSNLDDEGIGDQV